MFDRIIHSNNGVLTDLSVELNDYHNGITTIPLIDSNQKLFIGSRLPFNHRYFKIQAPNTQSGQINIRYWNGNKFIPVVEIIDETSVSGVPFAQSGFITFVPNKLELWSREDTVDLNGIPKITGLENITIYDLYWIEISVDSPINAETSLSWFGNIFSNDDDLGSEYPDLIRSNVIASFKESKTDWEEQHVIAASLIIDDLIARKVIKSGNQILDKRTLKNIAVQKVAEVIFNAFGDDYKDDRQKARVEYKSRLKKSLFDTDKDNDGRLSAYEKQIREGRLHR